VSALGGAARGRYRQGMDFLEAKVRHGFDLLDTDGDDALTENDHVLMGLRAAAALGYPEDSAAADRIIAAYVTIWRDLHAPHAAATGGRLMREAFVTSTLTLADDTAAAAATVGELARAFFAIADQDESGDVDRREFGLFQRSHFPSIADTALDEAFAHLDRDADGVLSPTEFATAIIEYWSSRDTTAPGTWWMGRPDQFADGSD
jgi:hypothetical protein